MKIGLKQDFINTLLHIQNSFYIIVLLCSIVSWYSLPLYGQTSFEQRQQQISKQKKSISDSLAGINNDLNNVTLLSATLKEEIAKKENEIRSTNDLILEADNLIKNIDIELEENKKALDNLVNQMKSLIIELQKQEQVTPLQTLISSRSFGEAISNAYSFTALQNKAETLRKNILETSKKLEENRIDQEDVKVKLENSKFLLASQKSTLEDIRLKTQNDEAKYQQMRQNLLAENQKLDAQSKTIEAQRKAEIEANLRAQEEENRRSQSANNTNSSSNNSTAPRPIFSGSNCWFEDRRPLSVPDGFFARPTTGIVIRVFANCSHDAADIANSTNTPLVAIADGVVVRRGEGDIYGYGNYVVIKIQLPSKQVVYALYAHMNSKSPREVGEVVRRGQVVGYMGCTGECYGTHVHFMLYSDTYETNGPGCRLGSSKCYNPAKYISL